MRLHARALGAVAVLLATLPMSTAANESAAGPAQEPITAGSTRPVLPPTPEPVTVDDRLGPLLG